jgi:3',5'-cyclic AMP phosphodiesterase CpdA
VLLAQITDTHLGFDAHNPRELNRRRLDQVVAKLNTVAPTPDLLLCTGDLTENGDAPSFHRLREALAPLRFPYHLAVGNHDRRKPLLEVFPETPTADGFIQYVIEAGPLRVIVLDTLYEGRHGGAFGPRRAAWLKARLDEAPDRATLIVLHHPPVATGVAWMTLGASERWPDRLSEIVSARPAIVGALAGHVHTPIVAPWAGTTLRVAASVAPQVALELAPIDLDRPDQRPMLQVEPPAFALHQWSPETGLVTHFARAEKAKVIVRYDRRFQPVVRSLVQERATEPEAPDGL